MSLLLDAGIDPPKSISVGLRRPGAAKIFVQDKSFEPSWAGRRTSTTFQASEGHTPGRQHRQRQPSIADVGPCATILRDQPAIVAGLVQVFFEGMDMVRKDIPGAARCSPRPTTCPSRIARPDWRRTAASTRATPPHQLPRKLNFFSTPSTPPTSKSSGTAPSTIYRPSAAFSSRSPPQGQSRRVLAKLSRIQGSARPLPAHFQAPAHFSRTPKRKPGRFSPVRHHHLEPNRAVLMRSTIPASPTVLDGNRQPGWRVRQRYVVIEATPTPAGKASYHRDLVRQLSYEPRRRRAQIDQSKNTNLIRINSRSSATAGTIPSPA